MKVLFVDRDGTLIEEPSDEQVDSLEKIRFLPGVFAALTELQAAGFRLAMVTNQDGLGTDSFPTEHFELPQRFILDAFASQGITFDAIFICPHKKSDGCDCRKPSTKLIDQWVREKGVDLRQSAMIGDRQTDLDFANNLGIRGLKVLARGETAYSWPAIVKELTARRATAHRKTRETDILVTVDLDAEGPISAKTGIGFFDHMLEQLGKHGSTDLSIQVKGDLHIDEHHTIEDTALALGEAYSKALGDKKGIYRYGFLLPMDDALAQVAIDFGGRPWCVWDANFMREKVGDMPTELFFHFFKSFSDTAKCNLNISITGDNEHHKIEATFKGLARAIKMAVQRDPRNLNQLPSTKGVL